MGRLWQGQAPLKEGQHGLRQGRTACWQGHMSSLTQVVIVFLLSFLQKGLGLRLWKRVGGSQGLWT